MSNTRPELSWIVPLYRNGGYAAELIRRAHAAAQTTGIACEIVFIDDHCPELSGQAAEEGGRRHPLACGRVLKLPVNQGQDGAIREGLRACQGTHALIIDGDLQDPPEMLAQLWPPMMQQRPDVIFAARQGAYESAGRLATSRLYRKAMEWVGGLPPRAGVCALLNQKAIECITTTRVRKLSLLAALAAARLDCLSVPVQRQARSDRRSAYSSWARSQRAFHSLTQTVRARWLRIPL